MLDPLGSKAQDDDVVMGQVELALAQPPGERDAYIERACAGDSELIAQVRNYVHWEETMNRFLLDPIYSLTVVEHRFEPDERLAGRFRIVRLVAEGGMGVVYEAWDEKLERRIAVKCAKAGFDKRLPPEVRHASGISHPNVCKIHEIHTASTEQGDIDFFTMEFLEGETLADRLRGGKLPAPEARAFARQICAGLAEAHRHGVVHGDLKSNNVILATDSLNRAGRGVQAVITDFGLARAPAASNPEGSMQSAEAGGAPDYMAPELWAGQKASAASDVYALGVILYELESGRRPFEAVPLEAQRAGRSREQPMRKPPPLHTKWDRIKLDPILARCLDPDPARRYRDAGEVAQALEPAHPLPWWLMPVAAVLAIAVGTVTYNWATAPKDSWRLAMLPVEPSSSEVTADAVGLTQDAATQLRRLKGGDVARLAFIPPSKAGAAADATHVLHVTLANQNGETTLHAALMDAQSKVNIKDWIAEYALGELQRYAPVALAGMVTGALNLPPLDVPAVNSAAKKDYEDGLEYMRRNSTLDKALAALAQAVKEDPVSPLTYAALAEAQWFDNRLTRDLTLLDGAKKSVQEAEKRDPDVAAAHRAEGYLQYSDGHYDQARAELERAIKLEPSNANAYIVLGKAYEASNQFDRALDAFQKAAKFDPDYSRAYQNLSAYFLDRSDFTESAKYARKAVERAPREPSLHLNLAAVYMDQGDFSGAALELRKSIDIQETPSADYTLGRILMYENNDREAVPLFQRALDIPSPPGGTRRYLVLMYLGIAYRRLHNLKGATEAYREGQSLAEAEMPLNPRDGYVKAFLGYFSAALGDRRHALNYIAEARGLFLDDSDTRWRAVLTYEELYRRFRDPTFREKTLDLLKQSTPDQLNDVDHWPDLKDLHEDPRFRKLLTNPTK